MSKRIINIRHHMCDGTCMWNGIEDVYVSKRGEEVPEAFFLALSSYGENVYLRFHDPARPIMLSVCDGRTRYTYNKIKNEIGLQYKISEGRTLEYAFRSIKKEIDNGNPVILGPLDMYHLPYLKMYHEQHIPMHYVLMIGYDDDKECIYLYDCGRKEMQSLPYAELERAWLIEKNAVGDKNGFIRFSLPEELPSVYELANTCLKRKAADQLKKKPSFIGINALRKIAAEFSSYKEEMPAEIYKNALTGLIEYFGMVPKIPDQLMGLHTETEEICYKGNCDRLGRMLMTLGDQYNRKDWTNAGDLFLRSGDIFEEITDNIIQFLCSNSNTLEEIPKKFMQIAELEEKAYIILHNN